MPGERPARSHALLQITLGTRLIRDGYDLVLADELMGHARTETTRGYSLPTADDAQAAITASPQTADQRFSLSIAGFPRTPVGAVMQVHPRLSPLFWQHVRPYGEVTLDLGSRLTIRKPTSS